MFIKNTNQESGRDYILDKPEVQENFLQFIPATVKHIINSGEAVASPTNNDNESNCIIVEKNIFKASGKNSEFFGLPRNNSTSDRAR